MFKVSKETTIVLVVTILSALLTIGAVFIILQRGVTAVRRSNASVFEVFNVRVNRIEKAIASPEPSASASASPSASMKRAVKAVVPSPAQ